MSRYARKLPWASARENENSRGELLGIFIDRADGACVAETHSNCAFDDAGCRKNADFIVRACNAHDDLVAALRSVYAALKRDVADPDVSGDVTVYRLDGGAMYQAINAVRAALAKAGAA